MKKFTIEYHPDGKTAFRISFHKVNSKRLFNLSDEEKKDLISCIERFEYILGIYKNTLIDPNP